MNIISLIMLWCSTSIELFFSTTRIIGYEYKGYEESNSYHLYGLLLLIIIVTIFVSSIASKKNFLRSSEVLNFTPIIFIAFSFLAESIIAGRISQATGKSFLIFIEWSLPAFLGGYYIAKEKHYISAFKYIDIICIILTLSSFLYLSGQLIVYNDESNKELYQMASYRAAYAIGLNIYLLLAPKSVTRFKIFNSTAYKLIQLFSIPILLITSITSGGRGGVILCLIYILLLPLLFLNKKHLAKIFIYVLIFFIIFIITTTLGEKILPTEINDIVYQGLERSIAFIGPNGFNWEGTSGRDLVYENAINIITKSPFFGYGIFNYRNQSEYPHNLFLELLMGGGVIYLLIAMIFIVITTYKLIKFGGVNYEHKLLWVMAIYPLTNLMFSGSYLSNSTTWFLMGFSSTLYKNYNEKFKENKISPSL